MKRAAFVIRLAVHLLAAFGAHEGAITLVLGFRDDMVSNL
jgi:hypothetical protein